MAITCAKCHSENPDTVKFCGECGTKLITSPDISITETIQFPKDLLPKGSTFAKKYEIIKILGRGGMGVVYQAKDTKLKRTVALKFLPHELTVESEIRERFIQEARAAAALDHTNICTVYEVDEFEGQNYIAMAYIDGENLKDKLKSGVIVLGSASGSKALLIVVVTKDLVDRFHAGKIVKEAAAVVGGGGGGRPDMAQAGGTRPEKLDEALAKAIEILENM